MLRVAEKVETVRFVKENLALKEGCWRIIVNPCRYRRETSFMSKVAAICIFAELIVRMDETELSLLTAYYCGLIYHDMRCPEVRPPHHQNKLIMLLARIKCCCEGIDFSNAFSKPAYEFVDFLIQHIDNEVAISQRLQTNLLQTKVIAYYCRALLNIKAM